MTRRELLAGKKPAICARGLDAVLAAYGEQTAARWRRVRDPVANPVGHALSTGLPELVDVIAGEGELSPAALEAIVRIRSVQELSPSKAVGFIHLLRESIKAELPGVDLGEINPRIEQLTLRAFDLYVRFREQILRLRQEELKRSVASILRRWHGPEEDLVQLAVNRR